MLKSVFCLVAAFAATATASMGVCYDTYDFKNIDKHFTALSSRFQTVRTFQTYIYSDTRNVIDAASDHGLGIYAGVWIRDGMDFNKEIKAVIDGYHRHPNTVKAVFVGNEDLENGWNAQRVIEKITAARSALKAAGVNVRIGTVQTDGGWLNNPGLADVCDIMGVNIYSFFGGTLEGRWSAMVSKFGANKLMMTETGWPFGGGNYGNNVASYTNAVNYFHQVQNWMAAGNGGENVMYFMYHDNSGKWPEYEKHFGLADANGNWKFDFSGSATNPTSAPSSNPTPAPSSNPTSAPNPAPAPSSNPSPTYAPSPSSRAPGGKCGGPEWNTDYPGNDMFNFAMAGDFGSLLNKCCSKCQSTSGCAGYAIYNSRCYIKSAMQGRKTGANGVTAVKLA
nr:secreted protein [Achlya hypogyna]